MSNCKSGYIGYMKYAYNKKASSIYCVSDNHNGELDIILLSIGAFTDLYKLLKDSCNKYRIVRIIPLSIQYDYISDLYNAITVGRSIFDNSNTQIHWVFPHNAPYYSEEFDIALFRTEHFYNEADPSISFQFIESGIEGLYDIKIITEEAIKYFSLYYDENKIINLATDQFITEIHMSGASSRHGGFHGFSVPVITDKIRLFGFNSDAEVKYLANRFKIGYFEERWV